MSNARALECCCIDVSKGSPACAAIDDLEERKSHYLPGQATDIGIMVVELLIVESFQNSWTGAIAMTR